MPAKIDGIKITKAEIIANCILSFMLSAIYNAIPTESISNPYAMKEKETIIILFILHHIQQFVLFFQTV